MDSGVLSSRLAAQLLAGPPAPSAPAVVERLLAVQAQDPRGARLAVRARSEGVAASDVDRALTHERSLVVTWLNRGTLHLVRSEDYPWLHALTAPPLATGIHRRLRQEGVSERQAERGVATIERALADEGPLTRGRLAERLDAAGVPTAGQALVHVLALASLRGLVVRGPMAGRQHAYALVRDWLGPQQPVDPGRALAALARRYLRGHGPASDRDLARWAGLPLRDARAGFASVAGELVGRPGGLLDLARPASAPAPPQARLLGTFEPVLLGWESREAIVGRHRDAVVAGGVFRAFALVGGRAAALWRLGRGAVELEPLEDLDAADLDALERDGRELVRFVEG